MHFQQFRIDLIAQSILVHCWHKTATWEIQNYCSFYPFNCEFIDLVQHHTAFGCHFHKHIYKWSQANLLNFPKYRRRRNSFQNICGSDLTLSFTIFFIHLSTSVNQNKMCGRTGCCFTLAYLVFISSQNQITKTKMAKSIQLPHPRQCVALVIYLSCGRD